MKIIKIYTLLFLISVLSPIHAQEARVSLGPEVCISDSFNQPHRTQYQADLRCDPTDPLRMAVTAKVGTDTKTFERETMVYVSLDGGKSWKPHVEPKHTSDPDCIYDNKQILHRVFISKGGNGSGYRKSTDGGKTWGPLKHIAKPVDHLHITTDRSDSSFSGSIYVAGRDFKSKGVYVGISRDHGETFSTSLIPFKGSMSQGFVYGPVVSRKGTVLIPYTNRQKFLTKKINGVNTYMGKKQEVHLLRSTDGGMTFSNTQIGDINATNKGKFTSSPNLSQLVAGPWKKGERIYFAYPRRNDNAPSNILLSISDDDGISWSKPNPVISSEFPEGFAPSSCSIMVNKDGIVGLQWLAINAKSTEFYPCFAYSLDGGNSFSKPIKLSTTVSKVPGSTIPIPKNKNGGLSRGVQLPGQPRSPGQDQLYSDVGADGKFQTIWTDGRNASTDSNNPGYTLYTRSVTIQSK